MYIYVYTCITALKHYFSCIENKRNYFLIKEKKLSVCALSEGQKILVKNSKLLSLRNCYYMFWKI